MLSGRSRAVSRADRSRIAARRCWSAGWWSKVSIASWTTPPATRVPRWRRTALGPGLPARSMCHRRPHRQRCASSTPTAPTSCWFPGRVRRPPIPPRRPRPAVEASTPVICGARSSSPGRRHSPGRPGSSWVEPCLTPWSCHLAEERCCSGRGEGLRPSGMRAWRRGHRGFTACRARPANRWRPHFAPVGASPPGSRCSAVLRRGRWWPTRRAVRQS